MKYAEFNGGLIIIAFNAGERELLSKLWKSNQIFGNYMFWARIQGIDWFPDDDIVAETLRKEPSAMAISVINTDYDSFVKSDDKRDLEIEYLQKENEKFRKIISDRIIPSKEMKEIMRPPDSEDFKKKVTQTNFNLFDGI